MSPISIVDPSSPDCSSDELVTTEKDRRDANYPYLKPIKHSSAEQPLAIDDGRMSPDIPVYVPVPVKVPQLGHRLRNVELKKEPQASAIEKYRNDAVSIVLMTMRRYQCNIL